MKKFQQLFLWLGIATVVASIVLITVTSVKDIKASYEFVLEKDVYKNMGEFWFWNFLEIIFVKFPVILSEISLIKNGYVLFIKEQSKSKKIHCFISSILAIIALILLYIGVNGKQMYHVRQNYILASWLILIISFIVGIVGSVIRLFRVSTVEQSGDSSVS